MKRHSVFAWLVLAALFIGVTACDDSSTNSNPDENSGNSKEVTIDASAWDTWTYYSFSQGKEVVISDFSTSMDWDIGFHRSDVRLNGGASGPGNAGSIDLGIIGFDTLSQAPMSGYIENDSIDIIEVFIMPPNLVTVPGDTVMPSWIIVDTSNPPPVYTVTNNIFAVKTADGKYAKVWLKSFHNENAESGHVTMEYVYQPDGSNVFDE
jgi:hypothetical protein